MIDLGFNGTSYREFFYSFSMSFYGFYLDKSDQRKDILPTV